MHSIAIADIAAHSILLVTGLSGNIFILIVHFLEWLKTRLYNPCDLIINSIVISNICLQIANDMTELLIYICPDIFLQLWVYTLSIALISSLTLSSLWCSTCLCFYYCVKIVNLNGSLFYKIKAKLFVLVPWLIVFSLVLSWSVGMPAYWDFYLIYSISASGNVTVEEPWYLGSKCNCLYYLYIIVASFAFVVIFLAGGTIIISLCKHMSRMNQNNERSGHSKVRSHFSAAKTVTSLLILYLIFYGTFSFINNPVYVLDYLTTILCFIVISAFPTVNAIILITGNRKLSDALRRAMGRKPSVVTTEVTVTTY